MSEPLRLTPDILESLLVDLDDGEFAAFVADLYGRTGRDTGRQGSVVTAVTPEGDRERLLVWTDERTRIERLLGTDPPDPDTEGIDAVVSRERDGAAAAVIAEESGIDHLGTAALHDRLLYAMDRETCRDLCQEHFGRAVEPRPPPAEESGSTVLAGLPQGRIALAALVVCSLIVVGAAGLPGAMMPDRDATVPGEGTEAGDLPESGPVTPVAGSGGSPTPTPAPPSTPLPTITNATAIDLTDGDGVVSEGDTVELRAIVNETDSDLAQVFAVPEQFGVERVGLIPAGGFYTGTFVVGSEFPVTDGSWQIPIIAENGAGYDVDTLTNHLRVGKDRVNVTGSLGNGSTGAKTVFAVPSDADRAFPENGPFEARTLTDENGSFTLEVPVNGTYDIFYWQGDFLNTPDTFPRHGDFLDAPKLFPRDGIPDVFAIERVAVGDSDVSVGDQVPPAGHDLNVSVVNESGDPIEGAQVTYVHTENGSDDPVVTSLRPLSTNANGLADVPEFETIARGIPGLEVAGNVTVIVTPPNPGNEFVDREYRRTLTVTGDERITVTINETEEPDETPPTITNATAIDLEDGDGVVSDGDRVAVRAFVTDESGVRRGYAFVEPFGVYLPLPMTDVDGDGVYNTTFRVNAGQADSDGSYTIGLGAVDEPGNVNFGQVSTNALRLNTSEATTTGR